MIERKVVERMLLKRVVRMPWRFFCSGENWGGIYHSLKWNGAIRESLQGLDILPRGLTFTGTGNWPTSENKVLRRERLWLKQLVTGLHFHGSILPSTCEQSCFPKARYRTLELNHLKGSSLRKLPRGMKWPQQWNRLIETSNRGVVRGQLEEVLPRSRKLKLRDLQRQWS